MPNESNSEIDPRILEMVDEALANPEKFVHRDRPAKLRPYDPFCHKYARDMTAYDSHVIANMEDAYENENFLELPYLVKARLREEYVMSTEGTYNSENGHFACDECYIKIGMPGGPYGWVAP